MPAERFTYGDLLEATIVFYKHDGTETTSDEFELELSDGDHVTRRTIPIAVSPVDDETPRLTINNGLEVEINETKIIGNDVLKVRAGFFCFTRSTRTLSRLSKTLEQLTTHVE